MRKPQYLSPSSMSKWAADPNGYYLRYFSESPPPGEPQTKPMSVGSAFDAYVKSFLYSELKLGSDPTFQRDAIFEEQVEPHNRDFARKAGEHCFKMYSQVGALDALLLDLGRSKGPPRFEMDLRGKASFGHNGVVRSVPFRVKPDLCYVNEHGATVIFDWKVNGYCGNPGVSPMKGFVRARRDGKFPWTHDDATLQTHKGMLVNVANSLEHYSEEWARQLSIGGWLFGQDVGSQFVCCIHQLACRLPTVTVAEHVCFVSATFQESLFASAAVMWDAINTVVHDQGCPNANVPIKPGETLTCKCTPWVFRNLSPGDSRELCKVLDQRRETLEAGPQGFISPILEGE